MIDFCKNRLAMTCEISEHVTVIVKKKYLVSPGHEVVLECLLLTENSLL
jgi:hypothetical protein